jgi:aminotransferase
MPISERIEELPASIFHQLQAMAAEEKGVISLGPGEPDFGTPKYILDRLRTELYKGHTHYTAPNGKKELRTEIAKKLKRKNGIVADPEKEIIVTCGSTEGLLLGLAAVLDPTEEVLIPDPGYFAYGSMIEFLDAEASQYPLHEDTGFQPDVYEIRKLVSRKTKAIVINSPSNPTGAVFKRSVLEEIADIAVDRDLYILSDEAYEDIVYGPTKHMSIGSLNGMEDRVISLFSFSKSYAMAGFRVGYAVGPAEVIESMTRSHLYSSICAPAISQVAATAALKGPQHDVERMKKDYSKRREFVLKRLDEISGLEVRFKPEGAFYTFPKFDEEFGMDSLEFTRFLMKRAKTVTIPGSEFGRNGEGFIRMSYATDIKLIEKALDNIEEALGYLKATA